MWSGGFRQNDLCAPVGEAEAGREAFLAKQELCRQWLLELAAESLQNKVPVVLDWGFWKHQERLALVQRFTQDGFPIEMIYLKTDADLRWERLKLRNQQTGEGHYTIERKDFEFFNGLFEEPRAEDYSGIIMHHVTPLSDVFGSPVPIFP